MAKIILHIGLPKTATTTLQDGFFYPLHQKGMINYLGKVANDVLNKNDKKRGRGFGIPVESILESEYDSQKLNKVKEVVNSAIDENKINVLSEERLSSEALYRGLVPYSERVKRLKFVLQGHSVTVLYVLRRQPEQLYSHYIQDYSLLRHVSNNDTITKFYTNITCSDPQKKKFYQRQVFQCINAPREYKKGFGEVHCLFFEELLENEFCYYQKIATLFNITLTHQDIPIQKSNVRPRSEQGYISYASNNELGSKKVNDRSLKIPTKNYTFYRDLALAAICDFLPRMLYYLFVRYNIFLSRSQRNKLRHKRDRLISLLWGLLIKPTLHLYFIEEQKQTILALCKEANQALVKEKFCTLEDLKKYGYL